VDILGTGSNIVLIVLGFGLLIALHELGHFLAARWAGIRADGFAIGMGPVVASYRKGVGFRFGSCDEVVKAKLGRLPIQMSDRELADAGLGETEYSLRLLPIGGYVKMLGQEDANPGATSDDPRSYGRTPIGRRMVVVSAGVIMNLITAIVMFVIAFLVGVRFEAPVVGGVLPGSSAATAIGAGVDADAIGEGLRPGDRVLRIDGADVLTFSDVMIESAMSVPGRPLRVEVERQGVKDPLVFDIEPEYDEQANMRMMGVIPASSTVLADAPELVPALIPIVGDRAASRLPGRSIRQVGGEDVSTWEDFESRLTAAEGTAVSVTFDSESGDGESITVALAAQPRLQLLTDPDSELGPTEGLIGLVPLVRIDDVPEGGRNAGVIQPGDVVLQIADRSAPSMNEFRDTIQSRANREIPLAVLRNGEVTEIVASVDARGLLGVLPGYALDLPITARPQTLTGSTDADARATPIAPLSLLPRTRINAIGERPVEDWATMRAALLVATQEALASGDAATIDITITLPLPEATPETARITIAADDVRALHELGWTSPLPSAWFQPLQTTLSAHGNPLTAVSMGFRQTWRMIVLTYLTIDRLIGGSVSVKQLHGPVGIVHIGTKVADRGAMYLLFFLAMISVNLAVLNFLPLPIVDGGLFLFLVYEKFRGRPPSIAFQNAAALIGLILIGSLFVLTFYNDVLRLTGGG
jgi:regulator of sigma E protease